MAKVYVTIKFDDSDNEYRFLAKKPGRHNENYAERIREALAGAKLGIPIIERSQGPGPSVTIFREQTRETSQPNRLAEVKQCLRKAGYKTFINLPKEE
jgi:hypothetical protein